MHLTQYKTRLVRVIRYSKVGTNAVSRFRLWHRNGIELNWSACCCRCNFRQSACAGAALCRDKSREVFRSVATEGSEAAARAGSEATEQDRLPVDEHRRLERSGSREAQSAGEDVALAVRLRSPLGTGSS